MDQMKLIVPMVDRAPPYTMIVSSGPRDVTAIRGHYIFWEMNFKRWWEGLLMMINVGMKVGGIT